MKKCLFKIVASMLAVLTLFSSMPTAIFAAETSSYDVTYLSADDTQKSNLSVKSKFENTNVETKFAADAFKSSKYLNLMNKVSWGKLALETKLGTHVNVKAYSNDMSITGLCDGIIDSNSTESEKRFMQSSGFNGGSSQQGYLTVFLGNTYDISSIYLMSHFKTRQALYDYELYVGNDKQNLYTADNLVIDYAYSGYNKNSDTTGKLNDEGLSEGQKYDFTGDKARGRYVGIKIIKGETVTGFLSSFKSPEYFWLSEFGIEGTKVADEYKVKFATSSNNSNTNLKVYSDYKNTKVVTRFSADAFKTRCKNNLLKNIKKDNVEFYSGTGSNLGNLDNYATEADPETKAHQTSLRTFGDGKLITAETPHETIPHYYNYGTAIKNKEEQGKEGQYNYKYRLTLTLEESCQISNFYMLTDYRANWAISKYDVFVSDDKDTLYNLSNLVVSYTNNGYVNNETRGKLNDVDLSEGQEYIFEQGNQPEGQYVGILIYKTNSRPDNSDERHWMVIGELGIEGTGPFKLNDSTVTDDVLITPKENYGLVDSANYSFKVATKNGAKLEGVYADGVKLEPGEDGYYTIENATRKTKLTIKTDRDEYSPVDNVYGGVDVTAKYTAYSKTIWDTTQHFETTMFYDGESSEYGMTKKLNARLAYPIDQTVSVTSYDGATKYYIGKDFNIVDGELVLPEGSAIPVYGREKGQTLDDLTLMNVDTEGDSEAEVKDKEFFRKNLWKYQICVTYTHTKKWNSTDYYNTALTSKLDKLSTFDLKTRIGEDTNVLFIGDDSTAGHGASASSKLVYQVDGSGVSNEPSKETSYRGFADDYIETEPDTWGADSFAAQIEQALIDKYGDCITVTNRGVSGSTSTWAKDNKDFLYTNVGTSASTPTPDLVIISYGANELSESATTIVENIYEIIKLIRKSNPECCFLLVSPLYTNNRDANGTINNATLMALEEEFVKIENGKSSIIKDNEYIVAVRNYSVFEGLAKQKDAIDYLADCSTLPNDFGMNVYANNILRTLGCFECEHSELVTTTPATLDDNGKSLFSCKICKNTTRKVQFIYRPDEFKLSTTTYYYDSNLTRKPSVTVRDCNGNKISASNYTVLYASGRKAPGKYKVTVKFNGKLYKGYKNLYFTIKPAPISKCSVKLSTSTYTYNGKKKTPSVTVKAPNGTKLKKDTHYTVKWASGRKNVGKYKVTITMKGGYTGSKTLYLTINPPKTKIKKLTAGKKSIKVSISKKTTQVTGYEIQYSTSKKFKSAKKKTISKNKTTSYTIKKLKAKKTYYVRVRTYKKVGSKKYYSAWSSYKSKKTK